MQYLSFAVFMLVAQFSPGPDMLLLLKNAMNHPLRAGLFTVLGIVIGLIIHTTLALTGVSLLLQTHPYAANVLSTAGGLYLAWLAFLLLRSVMRNPEVQTEGESVGRELPLSDAAAFLQGFITNLFNPKAALFLISVLATWTITDNSLTHKLILAGIVLGQAAAFWALFVWLLKRRPVRLFYLQSERIFNAFFGIALVVIAVAAILRPFIGSFDS